MIRPLLGQRINGVTITKYGYDGYFNDGMGSVWLRKFTLIDGFMKAKMTVIDRSTRQEKIRQVDGYMKGSIC